MRGVEKGMKSENGMPVEIIVCYLVDHRRTLKCQITCCHGRLPLPVEGVETRVEAGIAMNFMVELADSLELHDEASWMDHSHLLMLVQHQTGFFSATDCQTNFLGSETRICKATHG